MTKQEKIQEAYGEYWETVKDYVDENGWFSLNWTSNELSNILNRIWDSCEIKHSKVRPKSLQGIENNNGWVKIESEEDFPKENLECWAFDGIEIYRSLFKIKHKEFVDDECALYDISHYQPIQKPQPPLY